jgi:hypothetical protein
MPYFFYLVDKAIPICR